MAEIEKVKKIAELARLSFSEEELEKLSVDMNRILDYMQQLNELDTGETEPLNNPVDLDAGFREDKLKKSTRREDGLKNAPESDGEFFIVPKVIKND